MSFICFTFSRKYSTISWLAASLLPMAMPRTSSRPCCYAVLTLLFYGMFKPVNRSLSFLAALFSLAGCVVMALGLFPPSLPINSLLFFGPYCLLIGYLIFRSSFLPRILGVLMALAGLGWLAFLFPTLAHSLFLYIEVLGIFAEASLMLWLLVMGVNVQRWKEQAGAA